MNGQASHTPSSYQSATNRELGVLHIIRQSGAKGKGDVLFTVWGRFRNGCMLCCEQAISDRVTAILAAGGGSAMDNRLGESEKPGDYYSYLLRLWREGDEEVGWRASLHDPQTGERMGFGNIDELFRFLRRQIGAASGADERWEGSQEGR
jgi:hypothetical protein